MEFCILTTYQEAKRLIQITTDNKLIKKRLFHVNARPRVALKTQKEVLKCSKV